MTRSRSAIPGLLRDGEVKEKIFLAEDGLAGVTALEPFEPVPLIDLDDGDLRKEAMSTESGPKSSVFSKALNVL